MVQQDTEVLTTAVVKQLSETEVHKLVEADVVTIVVGTVTVLVDDSVLMPVTGTLTSV